MRITLGEKAATDYAAWSDAKSGMKSTLILRLMAWFIALPVAAFTLLALPMHASFGDSQVSIGCYARWFPDRHPYTDVTSFRIRDGYLLRDGNFEDEPSIMLSFRDGTKWDSFTLTERRRIDPDLLAFLEQHIGRQPEHVHIEER